MKHRRKIILLSSLLLTLAATTCVTAIVMAIDPSRIPSILFLGGLAIILFVQMTPTLFLLVGLVEGVLDMLLHRHKQQ